MSPVAVKEKIAAKRLNYELYDLTSSSFSSLKHQLKQEEGFSNRQVQWALELYVNDLEEELLQRDFHRLCHRSQPLNSAAVMELVKKQMTLTRLCAHDCVKVWFDTNVRILLKQALSEQNVSKKRQAHILYQICAFSPQQFQEGDQYPAVTTRLPYWLPDNSASQEAWQKGIEEEYMLLVEQFKKPVERYLRAFLHPAQATEICQTAFDLKSGENG